MAPLVLLNNFKFKYFFGVQIPTKNLICPIASLVSCNVLESNNTDEQKNFPCALELQSSSPEIFVVLMNKKTFLMPLNCNFLHLKYLL